MKNYYIGTNLLFINRREKALQAVIKAYVINENNKYQAAIKEIKSIGEKQNIYNNQKKEFDFEYIGIEDIFQVVGPIAEGAMLGRMTIWEQTLKEARSLVLQPEKFTFSKQLDGFYGKWYLAIPVYYVKSDDLESSRTISCHVLIESSDPSVVVSRALSVSRSTEFQKKIVQCDSEGLTLNELKFLGFEDVFVIYDDIQEGGSFFKMSKEFNTTKEIHDLLIDEEEIKGFFNEIVERKESLNF